MHPSPLFSSHTLSHPRAQPPATTTIASPPPSPNSRPRSPPSTRTRSPPSPSARESGSLTRICELLSTPHSSSALAILANLTTAEVNPRANDAKAVLKATSSIEHVVRHLFSEYVQTAALACAICQNVVVNDAEVVTLLQERGGVGRLRQLATCEVAAIASASKARREKEQAEQKRIASEYHNRNRETNTRTDDDIDDEATSCSSSCTSISSSSCVTTLQRGIFLHLESVLAT